MTPAERLLAGEIGVLIGMDRGEAEREITLAVCDIARRLTQIEERLMWLERRVVQED